MANIKIEPSKARATLDRQQTLERDLRTLSQDVENVRSGLRYKISGQEAINARLRETVGQISKEFESARGLRLGLEQVINRYTQTEKDNTERVQVEKMSVQSGKDAGESSDNSGPKPWKPELASGAEIDPKKIHKDSSFFKKLDDFKESHTKKLKDNKFYWDPKTKKKTTVDSDDEEVAEEFKKHNKGTIPVDVKLIGIGGSGAISAYQKEASYNGKYGGAEGEVYVSKLEGTAEAHAGLGYIGASLGATYTALSLSEKAYLGSEDYNVYEEVKVEVGRVGVQGDVRAGIVDKEGKFNPSLYAGASAEAIAGEISGKVGAKIGGIDVAAEGSLNYGVGAHANVGYHDGKFSFDVGATLGVGVSVKFDVDVSGVVDAVCEDASKAWSGVKNFFGW